VTWAGRCCSPIRAFTISIAPVRMGMPQWRNLSRSTTTCPQLGDDPEQITREVASLWVPDTRAWVFSCSFAIEATGHLGQIRFVIRDRDAKFT
jgi:hypothetical protein